MEGATSARIAPASPPDPDPVIELSLGHCGLWSPIDVDGALLGPARPVPAAASDVVNAAVGQFRRTGATSAVFVSEGGVRIDLRRHTGAGSYLLCD